MQPKPKLQVEELSDRFGRIIIEPLERGYGTTIGNSLRRVLLSSIPGAAVTRVRFNGYYHEYDTVPGVKESILEIILNLKELTLRLSKEQQKHLYLNFAGEGEVKAADIETEAGVEIIDPDHHIATLNKEGKLVIEMEVEPGFGYRSAEQNKRPDMPLGVIPLDADFSPVKRVNFKVEETRVEERTDYDRLILELETNGGIKPEEAISKAAEILIGHFKLFEGFAAHPFGVAEVEEKPEELSLTLEELDFDKRACHLLKERKQVVTLEDLLKLSRQELMDIHGFGEKTLEKVQARLAELGYSLNGQKKKGKDAS